MAKPNETIEITYNFYCQCFQCSPPAGKWKSDFYHQLNFYFRDKAQRPGYRMADSNSQHSRNLVCSPFIWQQMHPNYSYAHIYSSYFPLIIAKLACVWEYHLLARLYCVNESVLFLAIRKPMNATASRQNIGEPQDFHLCADVLRLITTSLILPIILVRRHGPKCLSKHRKQLTSLTFKVDFSVNFFLVKNGWYNNIFRIKKRNMIKDIEIRDFRDPRKDTYVHTYMHTDMENHPPVLHLSRWHKYSF